MTRKLLKRCVYILYTAPMSVCFPPAKELYSACNPVVSKPKPKVELPKDEKTENGPVNGHQGTENQSPNPDKSTSAGMEQETSETKLPEMDID